MLIKFLEPNFIFEDERGLLIQLVRDGFKQVNYITAKKIIYVVGIFINSTVKHFLLSLGSLIWTYLI